MEKKKLNVTCDVCDARNLNEENLRDTYESISLTADYVLVNARSKDALHRLPITICCDQMMETEDELNFVVSNGQYEIKGDNAPDGKILLCVNGQLIIHPGTEEVLKHYASILVNGAVSYPESLSSVLTQMVVNGQTESYPDYATRLAPEYTVDRYFPLRARENAFYYARCCVYMTDLDVDVHRLAEKNIHFLTNKLVVAEEFLEDAILLIDENVDLAVIPTGFSFLNGNQVLSKSLLNQYGTKLYINGSLSLEQGSEDMLPQLEGLVVTGKVEVLENQIEAFREMADRCHAQYKELEEKKGTTIRNTFSQILNNEMLDCSPDGLQIINCVEVHIDPDVEPERLLNQVSLVNTVTVYCTAAQRTAVELIGKNIVNIKNLPDPAQEDSVANVPAIGVNGMADEVENTGKSNAEDSAQNLSDIVNITVDRYCL